MAARNTEKYAYATARADADEDADTGDRTLQDASSDVVAQTRVQRVFNSVQFFLLSITFMSSWESIAGNLYTVFYNGGPQTLV